MSGKPHKFTKIISILLINLLLGIVVGSGSADAIGDRLFISGFPNVITEGIPTNVTFNVTNISGLPVSGANVSLKGAGVDLFNITDIEGMAIFNITATMVGKIIAIATKTGYINGTFSLIVFPSTHNVSYNVSLSVDMPNKITTTGVNATYILTITNTGNIIDSYTLTHTNPDNATTAALSTTSISNLAPEESTTVKLNITNTTPGTFRINVTAKSAGNTSKIAYVNTTTKVETPVYNFSLSVDIPNKTTTTGVNATYVLTVTNTGNINDNYTLTYDNLDNATTAVLSSDSILSLLPGANATVKLNITNTTPGTFRVNVTAKSNGNTSKVAYANTTTKVEEPVYNFSLSADTPNKTTTTGVNATYVLTITNTGNIIDSYTLTHTNPDNATTAALSTTSVSSLLPGANASVKLNVTNTTPGTFRVNVTAKSNGSNKTAYVNTTTKVETPVYNFSLSVDMPNKTTTTGVNATYVLTITNTGNVMDSYTLTRDNPDNATTAALNTTSIFNLEPGASTTVKLNVTNTTTGTFRVNVTAKSAGNTSKIAYVNTTTKVQTPVYNFSLSADTSNKTTTTGVNATYVLTLTNTGNVMDSYTLTRDNLDNATMAALSSTSVILAKEASITVLLNVTNRTPGTFRVNVIVRSAGNTSMVAYVNTTTKVESPVYNFSLGVDMPNKTTTTGVNATYVLITTNTGNVNDNYTLTHTNPDNATTAALNTTSTSILKPGESTTEILNVTNATPGTFRVNVTVRSAGNASKIAYVNTTTTVNPMVTPAPITIIPGAGGDRGTGNGGYTTFDYGNILKIEKCVIYNPKTNEPRTCIFSSPEHGIYQIDVTPNTNESLNLIIEALKNISKRVTAPAPGIVDRNVNILTTNKVSNVIIKFKVNNSWLGGNNLVGSDVRMVVWDSEWKVLETAVLSKDDVYTYLETKTETLSSFAVIGLKGAPVPTEVPIVTTTALPVIPTITVIAPSPSVNWAFIIVVLILIAIAVIVYIKSKG